MGINVLGHQTTIRDRIEFSGIGVHSGQPVNMALLPAGAGTGILFSVTCPKTGDTRNIQGNIGSVGSTDLCTVLGDISGIYVATVEHLMAALRSLNVDNVIVEIDGFEVPVMDGSAAEFVEAIQAVGLTSLNRMRCYLRVNKPVRVDIGNSWGEFLPYEGSRFEIEIDFDSPAIGRQKFVSDMSAGIFCQELARARTFGFMRDVERLWAAGFALGSSLENSVVIGDNENVINQEGLRYTDEFVRHKALDAIGDLALAGAPLIGCYRSYRGGHKLNATVLRALLSDSSAFDFVESPMAKRQVRHAELVAVAAPAYAAQI